MSKSPADQLRDDATEEFLVEMFEFLRGHYKVRTAIAEVLVEFFLGKVPQDERDA